jgi:peptidyl-dipeptidase Dcp
MSASHGEINMKRRAFITGSAAALTLTQIEPALAATARRAARVNPLMTDWNTTWGAPPFAQIRSTDFTPAIEAGMARHRAEMRAIGANKEPVNFVNVIEAMERAGKDLNKATTVFFNLSGMLSTPAIQRLEGPLSAKLAAHSSAISQDAALFARVKALYDQRVSMTLQPAQARLLELTYNGFVRDGALLNTTQKTRIAAIDARLSGLQVKFGQNVLAGQAGYALELKTTADMAGLSDSFIAAAGAAAKERKINALGIVTLTRSSFEPFLTMSSRRDLREAVQKGWMAVGSTAGATDNRPLITEIVNLRNERAKILGFKSFAHYQLNNKMAKSPEAAMDMMMGVWRTSIASATREREKLQALAATEGLTGDLKSWDWWHYAEKVRKAEYDVNEDETKPYFELNNMIDAMMWHSTQLFGITFKKITNAPIWHPEVVTYEVSDRDGNPMALWYGDFFARQSKQSGAWMSSFRDQQRLIGDIKPIVYNVCNYAKAPAGQPNLLSLDDVTTLFHEFGHALHGMLSNVTYPSQSGTNVLRDFVEFPSQLMEHWVLTPEILTRFAKHHATGAIIPQPLVEKVIAAKNFNQGWATSEFMLAAIMDMKMHMIETPAPTNVDAWEKEIIDGLGNIPELVVRYRPGYFKHTFEGGYAAGYYSYIWAAVLECDAFQAFVEASNVYDPRTSAKLKEFIFASGGQADPMDNYIKFRGRAPGVDALLKDRGLSLT